MTEAQATVLRGAAHSLKNVLIVGDAGSGKTTLLRTLIAEISRCRPQTGLHIVEDNDDMRELATQEVARGSNRSRPDIVLVIDDIGPAEATDLLDLWATTRRLGRGHVIAATHGHPAELAASRVFSWFLTETSVIIGNLQRDQQRVKEILAIAGRAAGTFTFERLDLESSAQLN